MPAAKTALVIGGGIAGPVMPSAFTAYERLRRPRVEKIAARGARISHAKAPGPIAQRLMRVMVPLMVKTSNIEKTMAAEQRYAIDWDAPVQEDAARARMMSVMRLA